MSGHTETKEMMFRLQMHCLDTITGAVEFRELPHIYRDKTAAYDATDFFQDLGGEWTDHDNLDSHPIHVTYNVVRNDNGQLLN